MLEHIALYSINMKGASKSEKKDLFDFSCISNAAVTFADSCFCRWRYTCGKN